LVEARLLSKLSLWKEYLAKEEGPNLSPQGLISAGRPISYPNISLVREAKTSPV
jgi:hypothetical protein